MKEENLEDFIRRRQEQLKGPVVQEPMPSPAAIAIAVLMCVIVVAAAVLSLWAVIMWWLQ